MKFITVSGIDKSGKTTVIKELMERTMFKHYVVDRDVSNYWALSVLQNRFLNGPEEDLLDYIESREKFKNAVDLAILLTCDIERLKERFTVSDEPPLNLGIWIKYAIFFLAIRQRIMINALSQWKIVLPRKLRSLKKN